MSEGPINPDPEQQEADNLASSVQSHIGPLPAELEKQLEDHKARGREAKEQERKEKEEKGDSEENGQPH